MSIPSVHVIVVLDAGNIPPTDRLGNARSGTLNRYLRGDPDGWNQAATLASV